MAVKKLENKKQPSLEEIIASIEAYREQLFNSPKISATKFNHMQTALHWAKNIIRDHFGAKREGDNAWVK